MVPGGIKIGKQWLNVLAYADDIVLIGKNKTEIKQFCRNRKHCQKVRTKHKPRKNKIYDSGMEKQIKTNEIGQLTINNYTFERVENFKYLGVILNEGNNHQTDL